MFNLKDVYGCIHLNEKNLSFLVIEYKNGIPYYLHSSVEELKKDSTGENFDEKQLDEKIVNLIQKSEKKLNLNFTKLSISVAPNLVNDRKVKEVKLEKMAFTNAVEIVKRSREKLQNYTKNGYFRNYAYCDLKLTKITNTHNELLALNNIKPGTMVNLSWRINYCSCKYVMRLIDALGKVNIKTLNVSVSNDNLSSLIETGKTAYNYMVVIEKNKSEIVLLRDTTIVERKELPYSTNKIINYIKTQYSDKNVDFDEKRIYKTLKQSVMIHKYGMSNPGIFCETNDQFLSYSFISTNDIYSFCQNYTKELFQNINAFINEKKNVYRLKKNNVFFVFTDEFYNHIISSVASKMQTDEIKYHILSFDLVVNNDQRLIFAFAAILNLINKQKKLGIYECSIDPYYDKDYELMAIKKNNRLKLEKTMNGIIQKLVK